MEDRSTMDGGFPGYSMLSARNSGDGVSNQGKFNKRTTNNIVPKSDRGTRNSGNRGTHQWQGSGSATTGLPNWYYYGVATFAALLILIFVMSML